MGPSCLLGLANPHLLFKSCAEGLEIRFEEPNVSAHHAEMGSPLSLYLIGRMTTALHGILKTRQKANGISYPGVPPQVGYTRRRTHMSVQRAIWKLTHYGIIQNIAAMSTHQPRDLSAGLIDRPRLQPTS